MHVEIRAKDVTEYPDPRTVTEPFTAHLIDLDGRELSATEPCSLSAVLDWLIQSQWMHVIHGKISFEDAGQE
jgi:hypothetical protein